MPENLATVLDEADLDRIAGEVGGSPGVPEVRHLDPASRLALSEELGAALGRLSQRSRELLILHSDGWTDTELAEAFSMEPDTVRKRLSDVRRRLRHWLGWPTTE